MESLFTTIIPLFMKYYPTIREILEVANTNTDIVASIKKQAGPIVKYLEQWGASLWPSAAKELHIVGAAVAAFNPNITKWLQGSCNSIANVTPPLDVDGIYGPLTREGVKLLQAKLGVDTDGIAGRITQAALDSYFAKQVLAAVSKPA
jgi:peptidoglycan hydrolase-like protein with peptidoglycan-binding domain